MKITFPEIDSEDRIFCGSETPKPQLTPTNHIVVEFVSNRIEQDDGFSMFLYCMTSQIKTTTADSRLVSIIERPGITVETEGCSKPPVPKCTRDMDAVTCLVSTVVCCYG